MSGFRVEGNTSGNVAEVDSNNNLFVRLPLLASIAGFGLLAGQNGDGTYTASVYNKPVKITEGFRQLVSYDNPLFDYAFVATAQDTGVWKYALTTMTASQTGGFVTFNANATATTTTGVYLQTWRTFSMRANGGLRIGITGMLTGAIPANEVHEMGLFFGTITTAPADGLYVQLTSAGITGVLNFNGTTTATLFSAAAVTAFMGMNTNFELEMLAYDGAVEFYIEGNYLGMIAVPAGNPFPFLTEALPLCVQQRNTGAVGGPISYKLGHVYVDQMEVNVNIPYAQQQTLGGLASAQGTQGNTMGSTSNYTNSLAAGAGAAMTNTAASLGTGLGGQFSAQPTLAVGTDGIVCSFQIPQGSVTVKPQVFMCTGVKIHGAVTTVLTGGPVVYAYSLAYGHTAVSMATAEGTSYTTNPTTKAPRRIPLGFETYAAAAAVGVLGSTAGIYMPFPDGIAVNPGEFIAICAKNLGTVTTAGVITLHVTLTGYWV